MVPCTPCGNIGSTNTSAAKVSVTNGANRKIAGPTGFLSNSGKAFIHNSFHLLDRKAAPVAENGLRTHPHRLNPTCVESPVPPLITHNSNSCQEKAARSLFSTGSESELWLTYFRREQIARNVVGYFPPATSSWPAGMAIVLR